MKRKLSPEQARRRAAILQALDDQLLSPETPEVQEHYERLLALGYEDDEARELMASLLAAYLWHTMRRDAYTYADYVAELAQLPEIDWEKGARRAEEGEHASEDGFGELSTTSLSAHAAASVPNFLKPLVFLTRPFPRAAVEEAIERREESIPHLLAALEWVIEHPDEANGAEPPYMLHLFALYLLAQFREEQALARIIALFTLPQYEELTGDVATEALPRILASTCGGDSAPLQALIENHAADEWVRAAAVESLGILAHLGTCSRQQVSDYFGELFARRSEWEPDFMWDGLVGVCTDLRMIEHLEAIRVLYREGAADPTVMGCREVEEEIAAARASAPGWRADRYALLGDTVGELEHWHCFDPDAEEKDARFLATQDRLGVEETDNEFTTSLLLDEEFGDAPATPLVRKTPKVGRNEPCPCGSDRKYKKCCGKEGTR